MAVHDAHDDFCGLHRDLRATGTAIGRRKLFRMAARLGGAVGAVQLRITNLSRVTLASDMVFSDGTSLELPTMSGSVAGGLTAAITVAV